jgi:hypothetical protein
MKGKGVGGLRGRSFKYSVISFEFSEKRSVGEENE